MDEETESYILLVLSDSNLPTGSFVASSGFESFVKHGFERQHPQPNDTMISFIRDSMQTYAHSALPFVSDAHIAVQHYMNSSNEIVPLSALLQDLVALDEMYDSTTLNHVAKRASQSQGVALLTLFSRGFSHPPSMRKAHEASSSKGGSAGDRLGREGRAEKLVETYKLLVRKEETYGHLPICWAILTAALELSLGPAQSLHLFLHARGLLSAAVRLNTVGPYGAQQILLHAVRPIAQAETERCAHLRTGYKDPIGSEFDETLDGPATTWPLGEILAVRHDLQHSRIFNS